MTTVERLGLTPEDYADTFNLALRVEDDSRGRSEQTDGGILGGSDALSCQAKAVFTVRGETPTNIPKKGAAQRGTYLHEGTLRAVQALFPHKLIEQSLVVTLPSGLAVPLHPDEVDPTEPSVTDYKFVGDLALTRRTGPSDQQMAQRNLQYLAAYQAGLVPAEGLTRNLFVDAMDLDNTWVHQTPFDMEWVNRADQWFQSVAESVRDGEDGLREWPEPLCKSYCPFYDRCRPPIAELNQPITLPHLIDAVVEGYGAREERKYWEAVEKQAVERLKGVSGRVGDVQVVSTHVNSASGGYTKVQFNER